MIQDKKELRTVLKIIRAGGGMTSDEYRVAIKAVGLKQERAGIYFGRSPRVGQAWALGEYDIPLPVQWCLQFMVANGISAEDIE